MAEALLGRLGGKAFQAFSAGRSPAGQLGAHTSETLKQAGYDISSLYPKSWNTFVSPTAPALHVVVTLDDALKNGPFPAWFSVPVYVHWPFANPHAAPGGDQERQGAHRRLYSAMEQQMLSLTGLGVKGLTGSALKAKLASIAPKL